MPLGATTSMVDFLDKGLMPVAGGVLDQSYWFMQAARLLKNDEAKIRAESFGK
jgi:hypothetical protein